MEHFNKENVYDNEISPLMGKIIAICKEHGIPMIASFTYENGEELGPGRCTTLLNNIPNREDIAIQKACSIIRRGGHETFAITMTSNDCAKGRD